MKRTLSRIDRFLRTSDGAMTALGLFLTMASLVIGGLALDVSNAILARAELQATADNVAHAALYVRNTNPNAEAKDAALAVASTMMPSSRYGSVLGAEDIKFGKWHSDTRQFEVDSTLSQAVWVDTSRLLSKGNAVVSYMLRFAGFDHWNVRRGSVFETYIPTCFLQGFVAQNLVDLQGNNTYKSGFCIHSNGHVEVNSNNVFEPGTVVAMPDKRDVVLPSSGFSTNTGLQDALHDGAYQIRILNQLPGIISDLEMGGATYTPDYITGTAPITLTGTNLSSSDFTPGRIHTKTCSGSGQSLNFANNTVLTDVVLVTNCKVKFGQGTRLENTVVATTNTSSKSISAPSSLQVGRDDHCAADGGAQLLTLGSMDFPADLKAFGGQLIARGDISFSANANGIEGASFISGGTISGTSNMTMGFCDDGMERNFEALYFRMVS